MATSQHVLVVDNDLPAQPVKDVINQAKAKPGDLIYGSAGTGSTFHMAAELFKAVSKTDIVHIPYRGGGPAMLPEYSFETWFMVIAPAGTPEAVVEKLDSTLSETLSNPALKERMVKEAYDPAPSSVAEARQLLENDLGKWSKLIVANGIKAD